MSKLTITEAVKIIPVSESTLRRDLKSGKVSFDLDPKGRKQIDVSELQSVYEKLKIENDTESPTEDSAEPSDSANGNHQNPSMNGNDSEKVIELLEGQVKDLKERLEKADGEKSRLLELANNLQKQNELLMLPSPRKKPGILGYFRWKR